MNEEDLSDIDKRQAHLDYITQLSCIYDRIRRRKRKHENLADIIPTLEIHIASELQEFLNNG